MNLSLFHAQLNKIEKVLKRLDLLKERNYWPKYKSYAATQFRSMTYTEIWRMCYSEKVFDFLLIDESILQFRFDPHIPDEISYAYYENPFVEIISLEEFMEESNLDFYDAQRSYDFYIEERKEKSTVTPIRYDYNPEIYTPGRHPAAHIHFGHSSEIRVGTKKILLPISFLLFVLRQYFPSKWLIFIDSPDADILCRNVRDNLADISSDKWKRKDELEMILT